MVTTSTETLAAHARGYAQAVRLHLADLGPDVVEDLTDGLEADLTDAYLDRSVADGAPTSLAGPEAPTRVLDLAAVFGPPVAYATELRSAAGLPDRPEAAPARRGQLRRSLATAWESGAARWTTFWRPVTSTPLGVAVVDFARALTPVWWVLRGWVVATVLLYPLGGYVELWPAHPTKRLVVLALVVVSVQWGRGRWLPGWSWLPRLVAVGSVAAAVAAIPLVTSVAHQASPSSYASGPSYQMGWQDGYYSASPVSDGGPGSPGDDGVWVDGMQVSNLFAYDRDGNPLRDVQLFDDRGRPVVTMTREQSGQTWTVPDLPGNWFFQPATAHDERQRWNVYPLRAVEDDDVEWTTEETEYGLMEIPSPLFGVQPRDMPWPFLKAPTSIPSSGGSAEPGDDQEAPGGTPTPSAPATEDPAGTAPGSDRPASGTVPTGPAAPTLEASS